MGIDPSTLKLRIVSTDIQMDPVKTYEHLTYEVFHDATGAIVASNKLAEQLTDASKLQEADTRLVNRALTEYAAALWQFGSNAALGGYSPFEVSLILEHWSFERDGANWKLTHPLSGTYEDVVIAVSDTFPLIVNRAAAIVARVLPPPVWAWASSPQAGKLSANCVAVSGATSYNVYNDLGDGTFALIGSAPTAAGGTVDAAAGYYRVRMAGVKAGVVGILSRPVTVVVG